MGDHIGINCHELFPFFPLFAPRPTFPLAEPAPTESAPDSERLRPSSPRPAGYRCLDLKPQSINSLLMTFGADESDAQI